MFDCILTFLDNLLSNPVWFYLITIAVKIALTFAVCIIFIPICVLIERRVASWIQDRVGPNRAGIPLTIFKQFGSKSDLPFAKLLDYFGLPRDGKIAAMFRYLRLDKDIPILGLVQPAVDGAKLFIKQDFTPPFVRKVYFNAASMLVFAAPLMAAVVLPWAGTLETPYGNVKMAVADLDFGILWVFAIASLSVYGLTLSGWASNSKFPFLGGIRSSAQMISYELCMGLSVIPVLMIYGSLNLGGIVEYQADNGWLLAPLWGEGLSLQRWVLMLPIGISFLIFLTAVFAEANRTPFDMPECETDLVGGYHTEYSSMKFALFFMGEYAAMVVGSAIVVTLFLGGWSIGFGVDGLLRDNVWNWVCVLMQLGTFIFKLLAFAFFFVWVRWSVPRFRYDQVMRLGWVVFFEVALVNIFLTAAILYFVK